MTGLLFLRGILVGNWMHGLYALLGTAVSTGTALPFSASRDDIGQGLHGLNGTLTGTALAL